WAGKIALSQKDGLILFTACGFDPLGNKHLGMATSSSADLFCAFLDRHSSNASGRDATNDNRQAAHHDSSLHGCFHTCATLTRQIAFRVQQVSQARSVQTPVSHRGWECR